MGFGQWHSPYKGENWAQSFKFWKFDILHCSSGLPAPTSSFPRPEIFLRMCLTIALSMVGTIGRSLGTKNWPQSWEKQPKKSKNGPKLQFSEISLKISVCMDKWPVFVNLRTVTHVLGWKLIFGLFSEIRNFAHFRLFLAVFPDFGVNFWCPNSAQLSRTWKELWSGTS